MLIMEAIESRHSVRSYEDTPIPESIVKELQAEIDQCNQESGLHIQLVTNEENAFSGMMAHYGSFRGVRNYIALVGKSGSTLDEACGYYGERIVLKAQQLGLNTCWVAMTVSKSVVKNNISILDGEKLCIVLSLGYGAEPGKEHRSKPLEKVAKSNVAMPEWFKAGVRAALLAPTAMNQQKFLFTFEDGKVAAKAGFGPCSKIDLGIVKYHFEVGSGKSDIWK